MLLWLHVIALPLIALARGESHVHGLTEAALVAWLAAVAELRWLGPRLRSASATLGLLTSSATVVHLFDGVIEAHFHFFVMVAVVALYHAWLPFLLALAFVVVHHTVVGALVPQAVYNHPAAVDKPWLWGLVHGGFILAESIACLVYWRASERAVDRERQARVSAEKARQDLADAQELSGIGSWEWNATTDVVTWSDHLYALAGVDRATFSPSVETFLSLVHPEDRDRVARLIMAGPETGARLDFECRMVRADGEMRIIHALGDVLTDGEAGALELRGTVHDVTEHRQLQEAITHMAYHDPLTGLANRRLYLERLEEALEECNAGGGTCAVLFIDLDGFKEVNDRHGHAAGDVLLQEIAARLRTSVRESDTVGRFGGDEFAILCRDGDHEVALLTAQRIEEELRRPTLVEGSPVVVAASIGIAVAGRDTSADALMRRADAAMYGIKTQGRQPRSTGTPALDAPA